MDCRRARPALGDFYVVAIGLIQARKNWAPKVGLQELRAGNKHKEIQWMSLGYWLDTVSEGQESEGEGRVKIYEIGTSQGMFSTLLLTR